MRWAVGYFAIRWDQIKDLHWIKSRICIGSALDVHWMCIGCASHPIPNKDLNKDQIRLFPYLRIT